MQSLRDAGRVLAVILLDLLPAALCGFYLAGSGVLATLLASGIVFLAGVFFLSAKSGDWQALANHFAGSLS